MTVCRVVGLVLLLGLVGCGDSGVREDFMRACVAYQIQGLGDTQEAAQEACEEQVDKQLP